MIIFSLLISVFSIIILFLIGIVFYKFIIKKENIISYYTPFDNITGQSPSEFHEEKEEREQEDDQGDGKNKS